MGGRGWACIKPPPAQAAVVNTLAHAQTHTDRRALCERKWDSGASSRHLSHPAMATFVSVSSPHPADLPGRLGPLRRLIVLLLLISTWRLSLKQFAGNQTLNPGLSLQRRRRGRVAIRCQWFQMGEAVIELRCEPNGSIDGGGKTDDCGTDGPLTRSHCLCRCCRGNADCRASNRDSRPQKKIEAGNAESPASPSGFLAVS